MSGKMLTLGAALALMLAAGAAGTAAPKKGTAPAAKPACCAPAAKKAKAPAVMPACCKAMGDHKHKAGCCKTGAACCQKDAACCKGAGHHTDAACCGKEAACCATARAGRAAACCAEERQSAETCRVTGLARADCCARKASPMPPCCMQGC
jgi:hypothetical protein